MSKKPEGLDAFEKLLRPLAQVPKKEVEQLERKRKKRAANKGKPKK